MAKKILLIEDNYEVSDMYQRILERAGYEMKTAPTGEEGLTAASQQNFDLILLDIMLPNSSGLDVLRTLKSDSKTKPTPVLMLTALDQEDIIKESFELGATGYIIKFAIAPSEIVREVENCIGKAVDGQPTSEPTTA